MMKDTATNVYEHQTTQQNPYSISHLLETVTTQWFNSDGDWAANGSVVTVLQAVNNSDNTFTVQ